MVIALVLPCVYKKILVSRERCQVLNKVNFRLVACEKIVNSSCYKEEQGCSRLEYILPRLEYILPLLEYILPLHNRLNSED